jgi:hypothetical protein
LFFYAASHLIINTTYYFELGPKFHEQIATIRGGARNPLSLLLDDAPNIFGSIRSLTESA